MIDKENSEGAWEEGRKILSKNHKDAEKNYEEKRKAYYDADDARIYALRAYFDYCSEKK